MGLTIPDKFTFGLEPLDVNLDADLSGGVSVSLLGDKEKPVAGQVTLLGDVNKPVAVRMELIGDPNKPVAAKVDASLRLANLPNFSREDVFALLRRRVRMPFNLNFGVSVFPLNLFGVDALQFSLCGEPQIILDDYVPPPDDCCVAECDPCER